MRKEKKEMRKERKRNKKRKKRAYYLPSLLSLFSHHVSTVQTKGQSRWRQRETAQRHNGDAQTRRCRWHEEEDQR
jgi:hypothetical protein